MVTFRLGHSLRLSGGRIFHKLNTSTSTSHCNAVYAIPATRSAIGVLYPFLAIIVLVMYLFLAKILQLTGRSSTDQLANIVGVKFVISKWCFWGQGYGKEVTFRSSFCNGEGSLARVTPLFLCRPKIPCAIFSGYETAVEKLATLR